MHHKIRTIHAAAAVLLALTMTGTARAGAPFMTIGAPTSQPIGHYEFCRAHSQECSIASARRSRVALTAESWNQLTAVNAAVNLGFEQTTDQELFGVPELWDYPLRAGDCEDLVLEKRRRLIDGGWPVGSLLVTVVRQRNGEGHAVLTALTDRGDLVLDNLEPRVLVWSDTDLTFVKRQSEYNTGRWTAINDDRVDRVVGSLTR